MQKSPKTSRMQIVGAVNVKFSRSLPRAGSRGLKPSRPGVQLGHAAPYPVFSKYGTSARAVV